MDAPTQTLVLHIMGSMVVFGHTPLLSILGVRFFTLKVGELVIQPIDNYIIAPPSDLCYAYPTTKNIALSSLFVNGVGDDDQSDLILSICGVPKELCDTIYEQEGIPFLPPNGLQEDGHFHNDFVGIYESPRTLTNEIGFAATAIGLDGHHIGCYSFPSYIRAYMVLIAR